MPSFPSLSPRAFAALAVASAVGFCGCSSTAPQGLDRAVASAQAGILRRFPDEDLSRLRLRQIELLDRNVATGRTYRVQLQADAAYRARPEDLGKVYVRSTTGAMGA